VPEHFNPDTDRPAEQASAANLLPAPSPVPDEDILVREFLEKASRLAEVDGTQFSNSLQYNPTVPSCDLERDLTHFGG